MKTKKPMLKETVGAQYYAFNKPDTDGNVDYSNYEETIRTDVVKSIGTTENGETTTVRASGKDYSTFNSLSSIDLASEVVAFPPEDLLRMRGDELKDGLISSGGTEERPFFAYGKVVKKVGGGVRYDWYPKCQLIENTDDIETSEDSFSEQNDTVTIRAYAFNEKGQIKNSVDSEVTGFPTGLTEEKFFAKPIITAEDLANAITSTPDNTPEDETPEA